MHQAWVLARIVRIHAAGPRVRLELSVSGNGSLFNAEVPKSQFRDLALQVGDEIFVRPQSIRIFEDRDAAAQLLEQGAGI